MEKHRRWVGVILKGRTSLGPVKEEVWPEFISKACQTVKKGRSAWVYGIHIARPQLTVFTVYISLLPLPYLLAGKLLEEAAYWFFEQTPSRVPRGQNIWILVFHSVGGHVRFSVMYLHRRKDRELFGL
ncbi:Hypothetical protein NTJ_06069 [Nesidiocoris tenuis]|uniref:Uncharacterized protein n=1 Tax=Nesidiocoris tenuis TaxID=355587 RepID=A0ABN7AM04_9HEMI|nr:Hypothetical protein NTJ_06069 [Nesidiocoris tenuis]